MMKLISFKNSLATLVILLLFQSLMFSQDNLSYGIKAGLNFSTLQGPREADLSGAELESGGYVTGFNIGVAFNIDIIEDKFGVAPELSFTQKGGKYRYEGPGFLTLNNTAGNPVTLTGTRKDGISIVNSYISIPVLLYYKPVSRLKIAAGMDFGFLVASSGSGETKFTWTDLGNQEQEVIVAFDHNYIKDKPGEATSDVMQTVTFDGGGTTLEYPSAVGAYYFNDEDNGNYYNVFDMGLVADLTFYLTKGISLGGRMNYGLMDITNNDVDFSQQNPTEKRTDADRNLSFQVSLGFNF